jgi:hypothetical protein
MPLRVQDALTRTTEPVPEGAYHRRLVAGDGQQVAMIRTQRPVTHRENAQHRMALLQYEATKEPRPVENQKESGDWVRRPGQPPRSQEGDGRGEESTS